MESDTSSSEEQSSSDCSTDSSSDDDEKLETAVICGARLQLPQGLCERREIFEEFFSAATWNSLSEIDRQHLKNFLPSFPENDEYEKNVTLRKLFDREVFRFNSPLMQFHEHLKAGHYRPDIAKMRRLIKKAERTEQKFRRKLCRERLKTEVIESRNKLLSLVRNLPPGVDPKMDKSSSGLIGASQGFGVNPIAYRTKKRYFEELRDVREKVEESGFSSDENYPEGPPVPLSRKQKRHLNSIRNAYLNSNERVISTFVTKTNSLDLESLVMPNANPFSISEEHYKSTLSSHKRMRLENLSEPEYNTTGITITDILSRTDLTNFKRLPPALITTSKSHSDSKPINHKRKLKKELSSSSQPLHQQSHNFSQSHSPELVHKSNPFFGHSSNSDSDSDSFFNQHHLEPPPPSKSLSASSRNRHKKTALSNLTKQQQQLPEKLKPSSALEMTNSTANTPLNVNLMNSDHNTTVSTSKAISPAITGCLNTTSSSSSSSLQYPSVTTKLATLSDLDGIDMMNLPIDLEDSNIDILELHTKPELMQETHSNFFSLLRDIICSTNEHRMSMRVLEERLKSWQENPISPLNDWYSLADNWVLLLPLAINFLGGNCAEQPDDFVPYIEYKNKIDMHQWIGAGRDSDSLLTPLCQYWLEHRNQMKSSTTINAIKEKEDDIDMLARSQTPPPPRCPTTWSIRKANQEEIQSFREQEFQRYSNPHKAFTYRCNGYESVVGPVKGIYNNQNMASNKARGHTVLADDRPNYVTILTLVRDATARLPNGEGTRGDICELLKSSQYIAPNVPDNILQTVVSGALDRMHTQFDPCVKYEPKRKVWIYLHRNRSEEDFERLHQQFQGKTKPIKKSVNKPKSKPKTPANKSSIAPTKSDSVQSQLEVSLKSESNLSNELMPSTPESKPLVAVKPLNVDFTGIIKPQLQMQQQNTPSPAANVQKSPTKHIVQPKPEKAKESVLAAIPTPIITKSHPQIGKSIVKVISSGQGKSLIIPNSNSPIFKHIERSQLIGKQVIHPSSKITSSSKPGTINLDLTKSSPKIQQQILQTVAPKLQNIKNVTLLKGTTLSSPVSNTVSATSVLSQSQATNVIQIKEGGIVTTATVTPVSQNPMVVPEPQVLQSGVQNKVVTQPRLTPAQQQQILQTLKQKMLPLQQTVVGSQYRTISKQKMVGNVGQIHKQVSSSILGPAKIAVTDNSAANKPMITTAQAPLVAKVLTNAAGQVISVDSLLAHQKQHGSLPQGTTLRISGAKGGQPSVIQIASSSQNPVTQFTVTAPNMVNFSNQPKLIMSNPLTTATITLAKSTAVKSTAKLQTTSATTKFIPKIAQQLVNAKFVTQNVAGQKIVQPKVIMGQPSQLKVPISNKSIAISKPVGVNVNANTAAATGTIRMVNAANLNLAQIAGKPVLITSKGNAFQNIQGQNIFIQTQATNNSSPSLIISNPDKHQISNSQSNSNSVNTQQASGSAQVILSPQLKMQPTSQVVLSSNSIKPTAVNQTGGPTTNQIVLGGQTVRLQTGGVSNAHRVVLASQNQGQIITQQILLPVGFQGTPLNIKNLQGIKVVPLAQAQQGKAVQGRQVFARVMNPANIVRVTSQSTESTDITNSNSKSTID